MWGTSVAVIEMRYASANSGGEYAALRAVGEGASNKMSERWAGHQREHELEAQAVARAYDVTERLRAITAVDMDRRLNSMNELRAQIEHERGSYISRVEYEAKHEQLASRLGATDARMQMMETRFAGLGGRLSAIAALSGLATGLITAIILKVANL